MKLPDVERRVVSPEEWSAWAARCVRRPVLRIGSPPKRAEAQAGEGPRPPPDGEWSRFVHAVVEMAGMWSTQVHGAYALLGGNHEWVREREARVMYFVPNELLTSEPTLHMRSGGFRVERSEEEAIATAKVLGQVDRRFEWSDDRDAVVRHVARVWWAERERVLAAVASAKEAVDAVAANPLDGAVWVPRDALR